MKMRLIYALTCCVLLAVLVVANHKIDDLEIRSRFWQDAHTSLVQYWLEREIAWDAERSQWRDAVESRDELISWWESRPPKVVEKIVEVPVEVDVVQEREIEVVREVERAVYPRRFPDVDSAKGWTLSHALPVVLIADSSGVVRLDKSGHDPRYDCDDYADDYEMLALSDNISLWQAPVTNGRIWGVRVSNTTGNHVGMWTKIDNTYYYIEPQPVEDKWRFVKIMEAD